MKWKSLSVLLFTIIPLLGIRYRLAVYMAEETLVILSLIAVGTITVLFVQILVILLLEGVRLGSRWLGDTLQGSGEFAQRPLTRAKPLRSQSLEHDLSNHDVAGSRIHAPENMPSMFRWLR